MQKKEIKCISLHQREMSPHGTRRGGKWRICWLEDPSVLCWPNKKHWINSDTLGLHRQRPGWKRTVGKCDVEDVRRWFQRMTAIKNCQHFKFRR